MISSSSQPVRPLEECLETIHRGQSTVEILMNQDKPLSSALTTALIDAVSLFDQVGIDYGLIGGLAAMVYGRARFTEDVDLIVTAGHETKLAKAPDQMEKFGFDPTCTWKLTHRSGIAIDLRKDPHVPAMLKRTIPAQLAGHIVRVVDPTDLVAMKLRADRPQDDYDISELIKADRVDEAALATRVTPAQLAHFHSIKARTRP